MGHGDSGYSGSSSSSSNSSSTSSALSSSSTYSTSTSKSAKAAYHAHDKTYPYEVWYIVAGFIFICGIARVITTIHVFLHRRGYFYVSEDPVETPRRIRAISLRRLHLAVVNAYRIIAFRCIVPLGAGYTLNVAEVVLTAVYIFIMLFFTFISSKSNGVLSVGLYAELSGNIATLQTPLVVALAMKNNVISWITGVGFDKLNYFHRMTSRIVCVLLLIHTGGYAAQGLSGHNSISQGWMVAGTTGMVALAFLCLVSVKPARALSYETFIILHLVMILIYMIGGYYHVKQKRYDTFIWPSFVLWGFDRIVRAIRVVIFNHSYFGFKSGLGTFNATAEIAAPGYVRLTVRRPKHIGWAAGQSACLTMPGVSVLPFENHPFTIANADVGHASKAADEEGVVAEGHGKDMVFLVNAQKGFTRRLLRIAEKGETLRIFVDAPYGSPPSIDGFDTVVFIAGGSGVAFTNPLFVDLIHRARKNQGTRRHIVFIWAIRYADHMNLIYEDLRQAVQEIPPPVTVEIRVFITSPPSSSRPASSETSSATDSTDPELEEKSMLRLHNLPYILIETGRPDIEMLLTTAASLARGSMSVNACGPSGLTNRVRRALCSSDVGPMAVLRGGPTINLFIEEYDSA